MNLSAGRAAGCGAIVWLVFCGGTIRDVRDGRWAYALLLLAVLVLVPLGLEVIGRTVADSAEQRWRRYAQCLQFPAAVLLLLSCSLPAGSVGALFALPWTVVCTLCALSGCIRSVKYAVHSSAHERCVTASLLFLGVGGAWVLTDRAGFHPLDFPDHIVTLTAVHFHFAGFVLPLVTGFVSRALGVSRLARIAAVGVVAGVLAVAIGITSTQLGRSPVVEAIAGGLLAASGVVVGTLHLRIAFCPGDSAGVRALFAIAGASLLFAMVLAGSYALRFFALPFPWLDVPWMRGLHGTANAIGFALPALLGWWLKSLKTTESR
jgi:hypothetical protein